MTLGDLVSALVGPSLLATAPVFPAHTAATPVSSVTHDSRRVTPGTVFVALRGLKADGAQFAPQAVARGAAAIVAETSADAAPSVPWIVVPDARLALAVLADRVFGHPSGQLRVVGITGTNGKTTTGYLLRAIFEAAGVKCGLLGTVVYSLGDADLEATRTTPEATDVQRMLRQMVDNGCGAAVMEVSSHALSLKRTDAIDFAAGVFTNLTRDHLDFHGDMDSYFTSKRRLFELLPPGAPGVINLDDPRGASLTTIPSRAVTYAVRQPADVTPEPFELALSGLVFTANTPRGPVHVRSRLVGRPNVYNLLAAVATAVGLDLPTGAIENGLASLPGVPGRFQIVSSGDDDIAVVVDYAHTDDALKNLLETARALSTGRILTVFGCGGDRDRTKRPLMGAVAGRMSDVVVVTSDNPRTEDPMRIIEEVLRGIPGAAERTGASRPGPRVAARGPEVLAIVDRGDAVARAIELARPGDLVIVAGKGHEKTQTIGDRELPFDDVEISKAALTRRRMRAVQ
jgi:UDP-N-acetylmuramoyl-L-alanyl-D-glutamate--2,6-diaminopimelate ligase